MYGYPTIRPSGPPLKIKLDEIMLSLVLTGAFEFDAGVDKAALLTHLADCLRELKARDVHVSGDSVFFRGGLFRFVSGSNILIPFGFGELKVDERKNEVRYGLSIRQLVLVVALMCGIVGGSALVDTPYDPKLLLFSGFGFVWLVGGNVMLSLPRFKVFLRNAIDTSPV